LPYRTSPLVIKIEEPPVAEAAGWKKTDLFGPDIPLINVSQAVPGYGPAEALCDHLASMVKADDTAFYTGVEGIPELREALAHDTGISYGGQVAASDVLITAGCNQAFYIAMMTLAVSGSSVILPSPWYFNHRMVLDMMGIDVIPLPCSPENGMIPAPAQAEALIRDDTRAIVLVTPNNPTGAIYSPEIIAEFLRVADSRGIALVMDETYRDFLAPDYGVPHDVFADANWRSTNLIHLYSFSKVFSLTGYRVGGIVAAPEFIVEAAKVMDCLAICAPHIGQHAALFGLQNLGDWRAEKRSLMLDRVAAFQRAMDNSNSGYQIKSIGAYFAYMEHPFADQDSKQVAIRLAAEQNISCMSGGMFGPDQERMLRFAFANVDGSVMPDIAARLAQDHA
jgi:aspartate/methionine/tyrosine aminotransferase